MLCAECECPIKRGFDFLIVCGSILPKTEGFACKKMCKDSTLDAIGSTVFLICLFSSRLFVFIQDSLRCEPLSSHWSGERAFPVCSL